MFKSKPKKLWVSLKGNGTHSLINLATINFIDLEDKDITFHIGIVSKKISFETEADAMGWYKFYKELLDV